LSNTRRNFYRGGHCNPAERRTPPSAASRVDLLSVPAFSAGSVLTVKFLEFALEDVDRGHR
jgi:hypothetical protein